MPQADPRMDMLLTYQILGSFFVCQEYQKKYGMEEVVRFVGEVSVAAAACQG